MKCAAIAVIGAGLMGHGIAQVFAAAGHDVALFDSDPGKRSSAAARIRAIFELKNQPASSLERITILDDLAQAVAGATFVVEAVAEKIEIKHELFGRLSSLARRDCVLATNTSSIPIREIARVVAEKDRVIGAHFWNPPYLVPLVEVVQAATTSEETVARTMTLLASVGLSPVHVRRDIPGFIGNRLQHALKREAIAMVADGVCDAETIDRVVKEGFGPRLAVLGPLEQSDMVGLNLTLDIHRVLIADLDRMAGPHPYLEAKVMAGDLGMATGRGFREWTPEQCNETRARLARHLLAWARKDARTA